MTNLPWLLRFKETQGLHSVRTSRVPSSIQYNRAFRVKLARGRHYRNQAVLGERQMQAHFFYRGVVMEVGLHTFSPVHHGNKRPPLIQYSKTFAPQVQRSGNQAHAPVLIESFQKTPRTWSEASRFRESHNYKTKRISFLHG